MLCLVLQGSKCVVIGDQAMHYDSASYFVSSVEVPASGQIVDASPEQPYLALSLTLDMAAIAEILIDMPDDAVVCCGACFGVSPVTPELAEAFLRFARLVERPQDVRVLGPLIEREILYRLLQGPQGAAIRQLVRPESRLGHIRRAIGHIRTYFDAPLRVDELARVAGMSASAFHRHFKDVTAMSPIQYQKSIRLHEARRRLLAEAGDTARVAFSVGYESVTQFSREYCPPVRRLAGSRCRPPARQDGWRCRTGRRLISEKPGGSLRAFDAQPQSMITACPCAAAPS
jgi:AraC-like DNA-binding protein